jgi:hypothetical protein
VLFTEDADINHTKATLAVIKAAVADTTQHEASGTTSAAVGNTVTLNTPANTVWTKTGEYLVVLKYADNSYKYAMAEFTNGKKTLTQSYFVEPEDDDGTGGDILESDIDANLLGTWVDNLNGTTLTVTFASNGTVTWGGSAGSLLNTTTSAYQGTGYQFVWVANNGTIAYKYSGPNIPVTTYSVYGYSINGGELVLTVSGVAFVTLVKQ